MNGAGIAAAGPPPLELGAGAETIMRAGLKGYYWSLSAGLRYWVESHDMGLNIISRRELENNFKFLLPNILLRS